MGVRATAAVLAACCFAAACAKAIVDEPDASSTDASINDSSSKDSSPSCPKGCPTGQVCSNGTCKTTCDTPLTQCSSDAGATCVDTTKDTFHCGTCTNACALGDAGAMLPGTNNPDPLIFDGGYDGGIGWSLGSATCTSSKCGIQCPGSLTQCSDEICYDTQNHHDHCGSCSTACTDTTEWCTQGHCCSVGSAWCTSACAALLTDPSNCGSCGHACTGTASSCSNGQCVSCSPATITGPSLTQNISGASWEKSGLRLTALKNTTLTSFVVNNQGNADTVYLTTTTGTVLQTLSLPASSTAYVANVSWALTSGTSYDLILDATAFTGNNGKWVSYTTFPQSSAGLEVVATVDSTQTLQSAYWFTFTNLVSCP